MFLMKSTPSQVVGDGRKAMPNGSLLWISCACVRDKALRVSALLGST
jgi:hypothetical protein